MVISWRIRAKIIFLKAHTFLTVRNTADLFLQDYKEKSTVNTYDLSSPENWKYSLQNQLWFLKMVSSWKIRAKIIFLNAHSFLTVRKTAHLFLQYYKETQLLILMTYVRPENCKTLNVIDVFAVFTANVTRNFIAV